MLFVILFCLTSGNYALALEGLETIKFKAKTTDALIDSIPLAQTQAEADAIFSALMLRMASGETIRGLIDSYVTANRTTMTSSTVSVNDTVKAIVPSGSTLRVGYEYPASTQTSGAFVNIQNSLGTYTKTFSGPFLPCQMRAKFNFIAGSYTENKVLKTRMNISDGTGYWTVTASDVNNHQIAVEIVGLALSILVTPNAANIVIGQLYGSLGTLSSWPALAVGQYYRITTSVSGSTLTVSVRVWASRRMMMQAAV